MADDNSQEILYFQCDKKLKADFYRMAQENNLSPASLLRAFMRKSVKNPEEFSRMSKKNATLMENKESTEVKD